MGGSKKSKRSRKFAASGELKRTIESRKKHQKARKHVIASKQKRASKRKSDGGKGALDGSEGSEDEESVPQKKSMTVDDFLNAEFMDSEGEAKSEGGSSASDDDGGIEDNESFASVDDLEAEDDDEGATHIMDLKSLAEKDPEFYKYLQEHDKELLDFNTLAVGGGDGDSDAGMDGDGENDEAEEEKAPVLTKELLKQWQKALLEQRSLRALKKLLIAFRSAAHMNEEESNDANGWTIDNPSVFNKLIVTTLQYTPVVLNHHIPYKSLPNGKYKPPTQSSKQKALNKLILSYFLNALYLLSQLSEADMQKLVVEGSAKIVPYITGSRKAVKTYLKTCLELWSSADDRVRIAAFLALRRLGCSSDEGIHNLVLKGSYLSLVRSAKGTSMHTLPALNLMKNSASELYSSMTDNQRTSYVLGFSYIRQLAVHLRNSMKVKSADSYRQVYNWQFVHSIDFWALVLSKACSAGEELRTGTESELKPLIYPLVQVTIGAIKLIPTQRYYPLHFHLIRSLLHIIRSTKTYIPLAPFLLPILTSCLSSPSSSSSSKSSTLKPLDLTVHIRAPQQYLKLRSYKETIVEEGCFLLGEWIECCSTSIAFPEMMIPVVMVLRRAIKKSSSSPHAPTTPTKSKSKPKKRGNAADIGKSIQHIKSLVSKLEETMAWSESKRSQTVSFAPNDNDDKLKEWGKSMKISETPLGKWMNVMRKMRARKREMIEKARLGDDAVVAEDESGSASEESELEDDESES